MRSSLPKVLHPVAGQSLLAHVLGAAPEGAGAALAVVIGPDHAGGRRRGQARSRRRGHLRPARAARHRACGAGGPRRDRARRRRPSGRVRRYAADLGRKHFRGCARRCRTGPPSRCSAFAPPIPPAMAGCWSRADGWSISASRRMRAPAERAITLCNAGVMAFDGRKALQILERIGNANTQKRVLSGRRRRHRPREWDWRRS